ncbi:MAG: hypothetical protein HOW71_30295 [Nonomuraea sp.]|nr:hypothetical protein [Nonomuraea sp.]
MSGSYFVACCLARSTSRVLAPALTRTVTSELLLWPVAPVGGGRVVFSGRAVLDKPGGACLRRG